MTRAVLFDLDRTLIDIESHVDYCAALEDLEAAGFAAGDDLGPETSWGSCTKTVVDLLLSRPDGTSRGRAEDLVVPHEILGANAATAMPGLDAVREAVGGARPVAIVTLLSGPATQVVLERFDLWDGAVVTRSDGVPAKPAPDQVIAALDLLRADVDDAVMIGDSERDAAAAGAAGVDFVAVTNGREDHEFVDVHAVVNGLEEVAALLR